MNNPFYNDGLRFSCKRCSSCCRHEPGFVFISYNDLSNLCLGLGMSEMAVIKKYCRVVNIAGFERVSLVEKENFDCIFWEGNGCIIYEHRPVQCRTYPFWTSNLDSLRSWNDLKKSCPGVGKGKIHDQHKIDRILNNRFQEGYIKVINGKIIL